MNNNQFVYEVFGISNQRGIALWAVILSNIIHYCMCKKCGCHTADGNTTIEHFKRVVIPSLKKHDKWMQDEINERDYCWFQLGFIMQEDDTFWEWVMKFKQDNIFDTAIEIAKDAKLAVSIESQQSPLN